MSYSPVFSSQFIVKAGADPLPAFEVPMGFTAVIRDFSIYSNAAIVIMLLLIQNSASAEQVVAAYLTLEGVATGAQWQGRVVVPGGGFITLDQTDVGDNCHCYVGGYLLRNTIS